MARRRLRCLLALLVVALLTPLAQIDDETAESIEEEYNRLLRVKPVAPPYESYYVDPEGQARGA